MSNKFTITTVLQWNATWNLAQFK